MFSVREALVVVGCVGVGFAVSAGPGLISRPAEPTRWVGALTPEANEQRAASDGAAQRRIAELEERIEQLEAARSAELAAAIAQNEELAERNRALDLENQQLARSRAPLRPAVCEPLDADPRSQLRYWAQRMRDGESSFRGGLPTEWRSALNLLLRRERELDPHNPWQEPMTPRSAQ
jgi:hypothetical protein